MRSTLTRHAAIAGVLAAGLALTACSQSGSSSTSSSSAAASSASASTTAAGKPAPFNAGPVKVALVRQSGAGDYFIQWGNGAQKQAAAAGIELQVFDAQQDNAKQATDFEAAINSKPAAIILDHGLGDTVNPLVAKAVAAGIPVIVYDADVKAQKGVVLTSQSDESLAKSVLDIMATDLGKDAQVGYVSAKGFAPLDRRALVWDETVKANNWKVDFSTGKVKLYGIDISNADIELMTAPGSAWVATAGTDPAAVGAAVVRVTALQLAGQLGKDKVEFPGVAITQQQLRDGKVTNIQGLLAAVPALALSDVEIADWLPAVSS